MTTPEDAGGFGSKKDVSRLEPISYLNRTYHSPWSCATVNKIVHLHQKCVQINVSHRLDVAVQNDEGRAQLRMINLYTFGDIEDESDILRHWLHMTIDLVQ